MTTLTDAIPLEEARISETGEILARAFFDDPMVVYLLPDDDHRRRALPAFFGAGARFGHLFGAVYTTPGAVEGGAVWLPPGGVDSSD